jgi:hypothetical protein
MTAVTRYVGICPVCERDHKVTPQGRRNVHGDGLPAGNRMVLHGYQRPGLGWLHGRCFGVGKLPYELSSSGCFAYREAAERQRDAAQKILESIEKGTIESAWVYRRTKGFGSEKELVEVKKGAADFEEALRVYALERKYEIEACDKEILRMTRMISDWVEKPLRDFEDVVRQADSKAAERAKELAAKREAFIAKAKARKELTVKREAERKAMIVEYRDFFLRLAASPENMNSKRYTAVQTWAKMHRLMRKKMYLQFHPRELVCDLALQSLGLAALRGKPYPTYADSQGAL